MPTEGGAVPRPPTAPGRAQAGGTDDRPNRRQHPGPRDARLHRPHQARDRSPRDPDRRADRLGHHLRRLPPRHRQEPDRVLRPDLDRRLRLVVLDPEQPPARGAADPHRPRLRGARPHRAHHDRRRRRARARRLCGRGGRHSAGHRPGAGVRDAAHHGDDRDARLAASGSASPAGCGTIAASTRRSRRCSSPTSPSRS